MEARTLTDLSCAAYLMTLGYRELKPPEFKGRTLLFYFEASPKIDQEINDFYEGKAKTDPLAFADHLTTLRASLRDLREARRFRKLSGEVE